MDHELHRIQIVGVTVVLITVISCIISIYCCIAFCPSCQKKSGRFLHWRRQRQRRREVARSFDGLDRITTTDSVSNIYVTTTSGSHPTHVHAQALALDNSVYTSIDDEEGGFHHGHGFNNDSVWHTHITYENLPGVTGRRTPFDPPPPYPGTGRVGNGHGHGHPQPLQLSVAGLSLDELRSTSAADSRLSRTPSLPPSYAVVRFV